MTWFKDIPNTQYPMVYHGFDTYRPISFWFNGNVHSGM